VEVGFHEAHEGPSLLRVSDLWPFRLPRRYTMSIKIGSPKALPRRQYGDSSNDSTSDGHYPGISFHGGAGQSKFMRPGLFTLVNQ
jgi:hypothetical protein